MVIVSSSFPGQTEFIAGRPSAVQTLSKFPINVVSVFLFVIEWNLNEPRSEKTGLRGFRPGPT